MTLSTVRWMRKSVCRSSIRVSLHRQRGRMTIMTARSCRKKFRLTPTLAPAAMAGKDGTCLAKVVAGTGRILT